MATLADFARTVGQTVRGVMDDLADLRQEWDADRATVVASRGLGASAGTVTLCRDGRTVTAGLSGVVLTGTSEVVASIPEGWRPPHRAGHGFVEASNGDWWTVRATTTGVEVMGPAPAGTTIEGTLTWSI